MTKYLIGLGFIALLLGQLLAGEELADSEPERSRLVILEEQIKGLENQLDARDKTVAILIEDLQAEKKRLALCKATVAAREDELNNQQNITRSRNSLIKFQEGQISQLREVVQDQRKELKRLNQLVSPGR